MDDRRDMGLHLDLALQARLRARLDRLWPGTVAEFVDTTASTNDDLLQATRLAAPASPRLHVADHQSAGRGRQGRPWASRRGDSLTFSLAMPLERPDWSGLSLAVGVALADALEPEGQTLRIGLKWPNDLWLLDDREARGGRKLGGVLIETVSSAQSRVAVVGVGLNVRPQPAQGLASGLGSLQELLAGLSPGQALERAAPALLQAAVQFEREGFAAFAAGFARRDLLCGRDVVAGPASGVAAGVDASGRLLVRLADGRPTPVMSGEVSVRPLAGFTEEAA